MERFASRVAYHSSLTLQRTEVTNASRDNVATEEGDLVIMRKMVLRRVVIFCFANQNSGVFCYRWILDSGIFFDNNVYLIQFTPFKNFKLNSTLFLLLFILTFLEIVHPLSAGDTKFMLLLFKLINEVASLPSNPTPAVLRKSVFVVCLPGVHSTPTFPIKLDTKYGKTTPLD